MVEHERALLDLGYFGQTNFTFLSSNEVKQFLKRTGTAAFTDTDWSLTIGESNVSVRAAAVDLELWKRIAVESKEPTGLSGSEL